MQKESILAKFIIFKTAITKVICLELITEMTSGKTNLLNYINKKTVSGKKTLKIEFKALSNDY